MKWLALLIASAAYGQYLPFPGNVFPSTGGGSTSWDTSPVCHGAVAGNGNATSVSVGPLNCSGATHYFVGLSVFGTGAATASCAFNDGANHSFTLHTTEVTSSPGGNAISIQYAEGITGSSSVTFSCTTNYGSIFVEGWKTGKSTSSIDQQGSKTPCYACTQSPIITPTANDTLVLAIASADAAFTSISESTLGMTTGDCINFTGSVSEGGCMLYKKITGGSGTGQNVSFTASGGSPGGAVDVANFFHP